MAASFPPDTSAALNRHAEPNRLSAVQLARWQGLPLLWVDARPEVITHGIVRERPVLAMLEAGSGGAEFAFAGRSERVDAVAGTIGVFEPARQRYTHWRCQSARRVLVDLDLGLLAARGLVPEDWAGMPLRQDLQFRDATIERLLRAMVREVAAGCPGGRLEAETLCVSLVSQLVVRLAAPRVLTRERRGLSAAALRRVESLIEEHLAEPIPLAMLAKAAGFSAPHFTRLMKQATGCSPHRYVLQRRVERAMALLGEGALPIAAVAAATGFASQSHLTMTVARWCGSTPGRLRRTAPDR